jgi:putative SOS response-associated peptidase YedK
VGRRNDDRLGLTLEEVTIRRAEFDRRNRQARKRWNEEASRSQPATLASVRAGQEWLWINCATPACHHSAAVPLVPLIIRWGPDAPWTRLRTCFRCTHCGGRETTIQTPSWGGSEVRFSPVNELSRWTGKEIWPDPLTYHYLDEWKASGKDHNEYSHPALGTVNFEAMCNLYSNTRSREAVRSWFRVSDNRAYGFEPMPAIFPKSVAPIIRLATDGEREMVPATWGFPLLQRGYAPRPVTNVRDDKVLTSPFWRSSFDARRCLVPASSYCEPDSNKPAGWHWFALKDETEPRPLFAFPGIWKRYTGPLKKDGPAVEVDVFAFMTTMPNELTATIMHDRMPVLLSEEADFDAWLSAPPDQAYRLVRTYDAERMRIVQSGTVKSDVLDGGPNANE